MMPEFESKSLTGYDGTRIHYQDVGTGAPIMLCNGLGGAFGAWAYLVKHFVERHRILSWDYRGLFQSTRPDMARLTIPDHVDDLARIMDAEKIDKALFFGWSMGTQVAIEYTLRRPDRSAGLVLLCGAAGRPFDTALHTRTSRYTMPVLFSLMKLLHRPYGKALRFLAGMPYGLEAITATHLFWHTGTDVVRTMVDEYVKLDWDTYAQIMLELARHDARPFLSQIRVPAFILAATGDFFTPVKVAVDTAKKIPDCRIEILQGSTHFAPLERPDDINGMIEEFIADKLAASW